MAKKILIVDDDAAIRLSLKTLLRREGYAPLTAAGPSEAVEAIRAEAPDAALMDMNFSRATTGTEGLELLRRARVLAPGMPVVLMTAWGSISLAVEGMKAGAADFIAKPWGDNARLLRTLEGAMALAPGRDEMREFREGGESGENREYKENGARRDGECDDELSDRGGIIGESPAMMSVLATVRRVAATDAPVLVLGENGTGKELVARAIHANSPRRKRPFVAVNLGGIPPSLFESEMFGHVKGAFTGAVSNREGRFDAADGGTLFLDEIGELDAASQVKLLRALQEHAYEPVGSSATRRSDFRVVAATNADLPAMIADGRFREDLFYRINLITLRIPPLRERADDIPLLVRHFAAAFRPGSGIGFSREAMTALRSYPFPGNIRQLKNIVERAMIVSDGRVVTEADLELPEAPELRGPTLADNERTAVARAMESAGGNISQAAAILGITRQALYRRLDRLGLR